MTSLLLQFVFIALLVILPMALYRSRRSFMAAFYRAMTDNAQARKFYTQVLVVLLLLFHYVYTTGHPGQFGTVLSAIVCAAMFSARRTDRWLRKLLDRPKAFVACGVFALAVCIVPQLFTRICLSSPRRKISRRKSINTSFAPFAAQCDAVQARTCFVVQYMGNHSVIEGEEGE